MRSLNKPLPSVKVAFESLIEAAPRRNRDVLRAKLRQIHDAREQRACQSLEKVDGELSARGMLTGGVGAETWYLALLEVAEEAVDASVNACLDSGVRKTDVISGFVASAAQEYTERRLRTRIEGHGMWSNVASAIKMQVQRRLSGIPDRVLSIRHDYLRKQGTLYRRLMLWAENHPLVAVPMLIVAAITMLLGVVTGALKLVQLLQG